MGIRRNSYLVVNIRLLCSLMSKKKYQYYKPILSKELEKENRNFIEKYPEFGYKSVLGLIIYVIQTKVKEYWCF